MHMFVLLKKLLGKKSWALFIFFFSLQILAVKKKFPSSTLYSSHPPPLIFKDLKMFCFFTTQAFENKTNPGKCDLNFTSNFFPHLFHSLQSGVSESQNIGEREHKIKKLGASYRSS